MVKAIVNINEPANRILNIVKARENLRDKSEAINLVLHIYGKEFLEEELKPEFIKELIAAQNEETVKVDDWDSYFGIEFPEDALSLWLKNKTSGREFQMQEHDEFIITMSRPLQKRPRIFKSPYYLSGFWADMQRLIRQRMWDPKKKEEVDYNPPTIIFQVDRNLDFLVEPVISPWWLTTGGHGKDYCLYSDPKIELRERKKVIAKNKTGVEKIKYLDTGDYFDGAKRLNEGMVRDAVDFLTAFRVP